MRGIKCIKDNGNHKINLILCSENTSVQIQYDKLLKEFPDNYIEIFGDELTEAFKNRKDCETIFKNVFNKEIRIITDSPLIFTKKYD